MQSIKPPSLPVTALVLGACAMGISPIFVREADVGPFASAFWRTALALPLLWAWARAEAHHRRRTGATVRSWPGPAILVAGVVFAGDLVFWHLAIVNTTIANATLLATTAPVWVVLGSFVLIGEKVARSVIRGLMLCMIGAIVLIGGTASLNPERLLGDFYGLITSIFFGGYFLALRVARRDAGPGQIVFVTSLVCSAILLLVALVMEDQLLPSSTTGLAALVGLAFLSHTAGQGLLAFALGHLPAAFSSLVIFIEALAAASLAWLLLGESMGLVQFLGAALILAGVYAARPR
ncbi:MAG: DMT family transporter [Alphaproteobacteria bacterium]